MDGDRIYSGDPLPEDERILEDWEAFAAKPIPRLTPEMVDLEPLRNAIRQYKMMAIWADSIFELTQEEQKAKARTRALEAKEAFVRIMTSSNNDGAYGYAEWAVKTALGLRTSKRYTAQAIGGKHWKAWGPTPGNDD